jgi:hypothetical protein
VQYTDLELHSVNVNLIYSQMLHLFTVPQATYLPMWVGDMHLFTVLQATLPHMMQGRFLEGQQVINNL